MDRIEQLMKDAKPRVGAPDAAPEATLPARLPFPRIRTLFFWQGALRHDAMPCGLRPRLYWLLQLSLARWLSADNLMPHQHPDQPRRASRRRLPPAISSPRIPHPVHCRPHRPSAKRVPPLFLAPAGSHAPWPTLTSSAMTSSAPIIPIAPAEQGYYTVLGCAGGWLTPYSISGDGIRALQLDGGNAWFKIAKLQNGRFLCDVRQEWSSVYNWEFQATNNQGLTPQQAMDKEFADKGIPVELRPQLVGDGPAAG